MALPIARYATHEDFDTLFPVEHRQEFWKLVRKTLTEVFSCKPDLADLYQKKVESDADDQLFVTGASSGVSPQKSVRDLPVSIGERIATYHASPLSIAADLAGFKGPIPDEKLRKFLILQRDYAKALGIELPKEEGQAKAV